MNLIHNAKTRIQQETICIGNHTVFLVQFGIYLYAWVFPKAEIARAASASAISAFIKIHKCNMSYSSLDIMHSSQRRDESRPI